MRTYYKVLGIPESATHSEIRQAYRNLAALHHPDHNPHDTLALYEMKMINEAYGVLSDPVKRARYDRINSFRDAPIVPQAGSMLEGTPGFQFDDLPAQPPARRHKPFSMSTDEIPRHPESIVNILWAVQDPKRNNITSSMKYVLWIDVCVSIVYLIYYFTMRSELPLMPPGSRKFIFMYRQMVLSWMAHFEFAAYCELIASIIALYWMKRTGKSHFLKPYLLIKCYLFVSLAAAFFGLTSVETGLFVPTTVLLWKAFLILSLFISRLDQNLWRFGKSSY